jgi:hypothetical protein
LSRLTSFSTRSALIHPSSLSGNHARVPFAYKSSCDLDIITDQREASLSKNDWVSIQKPPFRPAPSFAEVGGEAKEARSGGKVVSRSLCPLQGALTEHSKNGKSGSVTCFDAVGNETRNEDQGSVRETRMKFDWTRWNRRLPLDCSGHAATVLLQIPSFLVTPITVTLSSSLTACRSEPAMQLNI